MKTGFLKCYYGYQNWGDELLFFGVIKYLLIQLQFDKIKVEVGDKAHFKHRLELNTSLIGSMQDHITLITKGSTIGHMSEIKLFAGGEIFSERRGFHGGRNYMKYIGDIIRGNFIIMGGIETPKTRRQKLLYKIILPRAQELILRDNTSYQTCLIYNPHSKLYHDFALDVVHDLLPQAKASSSPVSGSYILVNLHPSIANQSSYDIIQQYVHKFGNHQVLYFRCGEGDKSYFDDIKSMFPEAKKYDRASHSIAETISLFAHAKGAVGARLHFLLLAQECQVPFQAIPYAEKIQKLIHSHS